MFARDIVEEFKHGIEKDHARRKEPGYCDKECNARLKGKLKKLKIEPHEPQ